MFLLRTEYALSDTLDGLHTETLPLFYQIPRAGKPGHRWYGGTLWLTSPRVSILSWSLPGAVGVQGVVR